ncbi:hypothetical protein M9Y10_019881 [Tritrichomonas musculus]|uniref:Uncharacterized protein n=1 Tax=Tritrichomonas musculus TaxID=1915356 RepID=A0ABR2HHM5_9EUKA
MFEQYSNAFELISVTPFPIFKLLNPEQNENAELSILVTLSEIVNVPMIAEQCEKALDPIVVIQSGIVNVVILMQYSKTMDVIQLAGICKVVNPEQSLNTFCSISPKF